MTNIGIDGGGTTSRVFFKRSGERRAYFERPVSLKVRRMNDHADGSIAHDGNFAESAAKLLEMLGELVPLAYVKNHGSTVQRISLAMGISGMSREEDQESLKAAIMALPEFSKSKIHIESDATMTLKAVLPEGEEGILLIAGTGSVVFYQPSGGPARRIGGWGPLLSDEGSGYRIGLRALRHYVSMLDGVYSRDALCDAMDVRMAGIFPNGSVTQQGLTKRAQSDPAFVASFAQDAFEAAENDPNDVSRSHIEGFINDELIELSAMLFPLTAPGVMSGNMPYNLYLAGGVAQQPMTIELIEEAYEYYKDDYFKLHLVDSRAAAFKALEIAKTL